VTRTRNMPDRIDPETAPPARPLAATSAGRIDVLQVLRLAAAVAVVCVHLPTIGRGYWGVDLFFVISGFVMCLSTERTRTGFMAKRLIRIVPLYWSLTLGVYGLVLVAPGLLGNTTANPLHLVGSLAFVPFDKNGAGHYPVLFLGWSLNFEMMFYACFAVALALAPEKRAVLASFIVLVVYAASATFAEDFPFIVYSNPIVFEFCLGMLIYLLLARPDQWQIQAVATAAIIAAGLLLVEPGFTGQGAGIRAGLMCAGVVALAVLLCGRLRMPAVAVLLGEASYALYLTHPYIIQATVRLGWFQAGGAAAILATVAAMAACLSLAAVLWLRVERPLGERLRRRFLGGRRAP
jgi:exopolysaccharide production protein ExoZ